MSDEKPTPKNTPQKNEAGRWTGANMKSIYRFQTNTASGNVVAESFDEAFGLAGLNDKGTFGWVKNSKGETMEKFEDVVVTGLGKIYSTKCIKHPHAFRISYPANP